MTTSSNPLGPKVRAGEHVSELAEAIFERYEARASETFEIDGFFGPGARPIPAVVVRLVAKFEEWNSRDLAKSSVKAIISDDDAKKDVGILDDLEQAGVVWWACRDPKNVNETAFPSPEWIAKTMTSEQIATLLRLVHAVRDKHGPSKGASKFTPDDLDAWVEAVAKLTRDDIPERLFAGLPFGVLVDAIVQLAGRCERLTSDKETLVAEVARQREVLAALEPVAIEHEQDSDV